MRKTAGARSKSESREAGALVLGVAADRNLRGMDQVALAEDGEAGRAAAHVDDGAAELLLVLDQRREAGGEGGGDQFLHLEVAAHQAGAEVA